MTETETDDRPIGEQLVQHVELLAARAPRPEPPRPPTPQAEALIARRREAQWSEYMPSRFLWARCEHFTAVTAGSVHGECDVAEALSSWGRAPGGRNLVLTGATGTGKSHAAVAAARVAFDAGAHVRFTPVVELLDALRPGSTSGDGLLDELTAIDVLVLDDLGAERPTDWTLERLYALVNRRWMEELPTIATTNLDVPSGLTAAVGERTYSRLVGCGAVVLQLGGDDRRRS